jgi:hypothetical protein
MKAIRVDHGQPHKLEPGEFTKSESGWWFCCPGDLLAWLKNHQVTEHEDGAITVTPSILCKRGSVGEWHGFITNGEIIPQ